MSQISSFNNLFSEWTKKYSLSKTLRFELKPVNETKNFLNQFIETDTQRDKDYKQLKKIIDEYHKDHIQNTLSYQKNNILSVTDLKELGNHIKKLKNLQEYKKKLETKKVIKKLQKKLREQVKNYFTEAQAKITATSETENGNSKKKNSPLFEKELITKILPAWLNNLSWEFVQNKEGEDFKTEKQFKKWRSESHGIVKKFNKFTTYLTGFHKNRKNMYSDKEQSTAISYRIVHENFPRFLANMSVYKTIKEKYPNLQNQFAKIKSNLKKEFDYFGLDSIEKLFEISFFNKCLSQEGIDNYNFIIGGKDIEGENRKIQGINELINQYRQQKNSASLKDQNIKTKLNNKNLPLMQVLYKQILSDRQSHSFYFSEEFKNREEVLLAIREFWKIFEKQNILKKTENLFTETLLQGDLSKIYFKSSELRFLSQKLFENHQVIPSAFTDYEEENFSTKKEREQWRKKDFFSFEEIHKILIFSKKEEIQKEIQNILSQKVEGQSSLSVGTSKNILFFYFKEYLLKNPLSELNKLYKKKVKNISNQPVDKEFNKQEIECIQAFLKSILEILHLIKPIYLEDDKKRQMEELDKDTVFYNEFEVLYEKLSAIIPLYNKTRNYITAKKNRLEKIKINFENSKLLEGWDVNKENDYRSVLFRKKENNKWYYYLGVINQNNKDIFDYHLNFADHTKEKMQTKKQKLKSALLANSSDENCYEKMNYKQIPGPAKMLPKVFFSNKNLAYFNPSKEIKRINNKKTYTKNTGGKFNLKDLHKIIDFFKASINNHYDWEQFKLQFSPTDNYTDISDFYHEINSQAYKLSFDKVKSSYIEEKVKKGELYLFQIYNKDFSKHSKGQPNLHTNYFKMLFEEKNLKDVVFKLNGEAEVFYRKALKEKKVTHPANQPIKHKLHSNRSSKFKYDIIKDKRFTEDKFFFHTPITLNFKSKELKAGSFNKEVLKFLKKSENINIIGIDRGERHLAYWTVVNQKGQILDQGSFNKIKTSYKDKKNNKPVNLTTDYHGLLEKKEKEIDKNQKEWTKIENIKELKSGYLSHLVHQIAQLMIKHNAIVIFEDLNYDFKRSRMKFKKQVYQKLEKALIDKLNYLVFKDRTVTKPGGVLNAYQLTAPFESFQKMGKQTGFVFYIPAFYTSKVCPLTGFVDLIYPQYKNVEKSKEFFKNFKSIYFDNKENYFVFEYRNDEVNPLKKSESQALWKVCSHGEERYKYEFKSKKHIKVNVNKELKGLFQKYKIEYRKGKDLIKSICKQNQKDFWHPFISFFKLTLQLRHINPEAKTDDKKDYILSPVKDSATGRFFDSRKAKSYEPKNADANGAYHISLKGKIILDEIKEKDTPDLKITNKKWFDFLSKTKKKPFRYKRSS